MRDKFSNIWASYFYKVKATFVDSGSTAIYEVLKLHKENYNKLDAKKIILSQLKKVKLIFDKKFKPYVIGKISKNKKKVNLSGKINW